MAEGSVIKRWFRRNRDFETQRIVVSDYREVFATDAGRRVLTHFLAEACFFSEALDEEQHANCNFAKRLLRDMGIWTEGNAKEIVDALIDNVEAKAHERSV